MRRLTHGTERRGREALRATALLTLLIALLAVPATAGAATGGALKQLALPNGCLDDSPGTTGCRDVSAPFQGLGQPAVSPDGNFLYVPARTSGALVVFRRNQSTGTLTQVQCLHDAGDSPAAGCTGGGDAFFLQGAIAVTVSPDGNSVYVATQPSSSIVMYARDPGDGLLSRIGCVQTGGSFGCASDPCCPSGVRGVVALAVSPDNESLYAAGSDGSGNDSVAIFNRNRLTGVITQQGLTQAERCFSNNNTSGENCTISTLISSPRDIVVTPDNKQVIVANSGSNNVLAFDRTVDSVGRLTLRGDGDPSKCVSTNGDARCSFRDGIYAPSQLSIFNNNQLYVTSRNAYAVYPIQRSNSGALTVPADGCVRYGPAFGCAGVLPEFQMQEPFDVVASPKTNTVYVSTLSSAGLWVFDRHSDGDLTQKTLPKGCVHLTLTGAGQCTPFNQGGTVENSVVSPDGRFAYFVSGNRLWTFAIDRPPVCNDVAASTPHNTSVTINLSCSDPDGEAVTYQKVSDPARGSVGAIQGNQISYGPQLGTSGGDSFRYRAVNSGAASDPKTVTVSIGAPAGGGGGGGGTPPPLTVLSSSVSTHFLAFRKYTKVDKLTINDLPAGTRVRVQCKTKKKKQQKKGCPYKSRTVATTFARTKLSVLKPFKKKKMPPGLKITITITAPGFIGKQFTYTMRKHKSPKPPRRLCIPPGGKPARCA